MAKKVKSPLFDEIQTLDHEQVMLCHDKSTGLKAIIGIHNTVLGPALGGTRFWAYNNDQEAMTDVLRLSRGMTFKAAAAGLHLGGGKAVIIGDPKKIKNEALLRRFGMFVENLAGKYITAEDVGVNEHDMEAIRQSTSYVTGLPFELGGSGDPSPVTAYGVYLAMKAAAKVKYGSEDLSKKKIVVQGVGKVGSYLVQHLRKEGATVYVYDIIEENIKYCVSEFGAKAIKFEEILTISADIYAPCALGAGLNPDTIPQLKFSIVCGGANNQLLDEVRDGRAILAKDILYGPDFLVNAGGLINVSTELEGYNKERAYQKAETIYKNAMHVYQRSGTEKITTHQAALELAMSRIHAISNIKKFI